jgi:hypothetical protein
VGIFAVDFCIYKLIFLYMYYKWMCPGLQKCDLSCSCENVGMFIGTSTLIDLFMQQSGSHVLFMFTNFDGHSDIWSYCLRVINVLCFFSCLYQTLEAKLQVSIINDTSEKECANLGWWVARMTMR